MLGVKLPNRRKCFDIGCIKVWTQVWWMDLGQEEMCRLRKRRTLKPAEEALQSNTSLTKCSHRLYGYSRYTSTSDPQIYLFWGNLCKPHIESSMKSASQIEVCLILSVFFSFAERRNCETDTRRGTVIHSCIHLIKIPLFYTCVWISSEQLVLRCERDHSSAISAFDHRPIKHISWENIIQF